MRRIYFNIRSQFLFWKHSTYSKNRIIYYVVNCHWESHKHIFSSLKESYQSFIPPPPLPPMSYLRWTFLDQIHWSSVVMLNIERFVHCIGLTQTRSSYSEIFEKWFGDLNICKKPMIMMTFYPIIKLIWFQRAVFDHSMKKGVDFHSLCKYCHSVNNVNVNRLKRLNDRE